MVETTLCYLKRGNKCLMLHRVKKQHDENAGKWIGVGGHLEKGESPEGCARREVLEETGLTMNRCVFRGVVDFYSNQWDSERMFLFTSDDFNGEMHACTEGVLKWIPEDEVPELSLWEGDRIFLRYLKEKIPFFHLALKYEGDDLKSWKLYPRIVLASQSPRRLELLEQIGIYPEVRPSEIPENVRSYDPDELVKTLSKSKANHIAEGLAKKTADLTDERDIYVIGADTVVAVDRQVLGKPKSHKEAETMIRKIQGRTHQVFTGVSVLRLKRQPDGYYTNELDKAVTCVDKTDVRVAPMTEEEIENYASGDEPMDKAGGYGIQGSFAAFVDGIDGDYNTVVGLPVRVVYQILKKLMKEENRAIGMR